ncbi:MAG: pyruvate dehydrogenase (acetyl-transferring) E1 component subunit alpha [Planctomycetes bacterium]|nr:pyruvate dehydrogenase (acetyl-transferring) E1 component subunit alpha [Planctomycetota bacterium]
MSVDSACQAAGGPSPPGRLELADQTFHIGHLQILDENGALVAGSAGRAPELSPDQLIRLYRGMVLARAVDDRLLKLQRQGRIGTFAPATGQEAVSCAGVIAMRPSDWFVGSFRELGGRLLRGEPIEQAFLYYNGHEEGNTFAGGERTLPVAVIIACQMLHAVGLAYAMKLKREDAAVVCFFGDGATSEGDFHEAMNFAAVWQAPVVFVCANNQWAISLPREKQTRSRTLAQKAIAYEMPGLQVDGNDALAVYQATHEALERARSGGGPTFIEAVTYRLRMHTTADDPKRYRTDEEVKAWERRDPIPRLRKHLAARGVWNDEMQVNLDEEIRKEIEDAVKKFEEAADFKPDAPFDHVFGVRHPRIEEQRADFLANLSREPRHE